MACVDAESLTSAHDVLAGMAAAWRHDCVSKVAVDRLLDCLFALGCAQTCPCCHCPCDKDETTCNHMKRTCCDGEWCFVCEQLYWPGHGCRLYLHEEGEDPGAALRDFYEGKKLAIAREFVAAVGTVRGAYVLAAHAKWRDVWRAHAAYILPVFGDPLAALLLDVVK